MLPDPSKNPRLRDSRGLRVVGVGITQELIENPQTILQKLTDATPDAKQSLQASLKIIQVRYKWRK